ncbi:MAG: agmatine deiminase family protein [bacterium]|nr:agmatine deiminase family protein [bacterium]MCP5042697.1 agmatine deiminase family protein [bacterium]
MIGASDDKLRWPAEWEPHAATWFSWPHNRDTWPGCLDAVERSFARMVEALVAHERVCINVVDEAMQARVRVRLGEHGVDPDRGIRFFEIPTDDAWVRDYGPLFVTGPGPGGGRKCVLLDFVFNAWGGKYPPWSRDSAVPEAIAKQLDLPRIALDWVLEGGSIDGNGAGSILTTESCLLDPNRNPDPQGQAPSRRAVENRLSEALGCEQWVWLEGGIAGDDTDGHVDDVARFISRDCIVAVREDDTHDANARILASNWDRLRAARDLRGRPFELVSLPMPPPIEIGGARCPASYANFYLANEVALIPVFDVPTDTRALSILADCLEGREVVPIPARDLIIGLGAVHCLTQQEPARLLCQ